MDLEPLVAAFRLQAGGCKIYGSPLYQHFCERAIEDLEAGGPLLALLRGWEGDPLRGFLPLRVLGAVHERVLGGFAPRLARYYPTAGGRAEPEAAWPAFREVLAEQPAELLPRLENFPQTNEVRRCAGLLGLFLHTARRTGLPLRLREIGCSAGLNLQWAQYRYRLGPHHWGDDASPLTVTADWEGSPADFSAPVEIESRAGCDIAPRAIASDADVRTLEAFVWADQPERLEQLRAAVALARANPPRIERASALRWLERELAEPAEGVCRVVYHSAFWIYLDPAEKAGIEALLEEHGRRATQTSPLARLQHESDASVLEVDLLARIWPGGEQRHLGRTHPHGRFVEWL